MREYGLHTHEGGAIGACEAARAFIRDTLLADADPAWAANIMQLEAARCSRLDLFTDWQGGRHPTFEVEDERALIKRLHAEVGRYSVSGLPPPSARRCSVVPQPPRLLPSACCSCPLYHAAPQPHVAAH
jgi:hypothetical protein